MRATAVALAMTIALPAMAEDCPLVDAIYGQPEGYELIFHPVPREDELGVSNSFELVTPGGTARLIGRVSWGNGFSRPTGRLLYGCASDSPGPDEEETCTHWRGVIYSVDGGKVDLLGEPANPAPEQLILSNLGQSLNYSRFPTLLTEPLGDMPWDVFTFKACAP